MVFTGRIYDIVIESDMVAKIVFKKKDRDKYILVAVSVIGFWKDKAIKEMKLKPKDKIKGNLHLKSRLYNEKYYTDVYFRELYLVEEAPVQMNGKLFVEGKEIDPATGEQLN